VLRIRVAGPAETIAKIATQAKIAFMYKATTRGIEVTVAPAFSEERSASASGAYFWTYTIEIVNKGTETVQLLNRHWRIIDAQGKTFEVDGPGVVGEQPVLEPGDSFTYTSGVPLGTPSGMMTGRYDMQTADGARFDAEVPTFSLDVPDMKPTLN